MDVVQAALFAVMVSLAALWQDHGVVPSAVIGASQGETAAACVAGALSLRDAARVVALRSQVVGAIAGGGAMVFLALSPDEAAERIAAWDGRLSLAAVNGPASVVVSGEADAATELVARCVADGVRARWIPVDYASHSAQVEPVRARLVRALAYIAPRPTTIPLYSTVTARPLRGTELDPRYWYENLRGTVRFAQTIDAVLDAGDAVFIELSPHPVLVHGIEQSAEARGAEHTAAIGSLRRGEGGQHRFLTSLAEAYVHGVAVDWTASFRDTDATRTDLPTYPFQRQRYWPGGHSHDAYETPEPEDADAPPRAQLTAPAADDRRRAVAALIRTQVAQVLAYEPDDVDARRTFKDLGFDSLGAIDLRNRLGRATGLRLPSSLLFDHPTIEHLERHLSAALAPPRATPQAPRPPPVAARRRPTRRATTSPSSAWPAAVTPATSPRPPTCGGWSPRDGTRSPASPRGAAGTRGCTTRTRSGRARATPGRAGSCTTQVPSTRPSSASRRARLGAWTPSSGCCSKWPGRRPNTPASTRPHRAPAPPASSSAAPRSTTARACTTPRKASRGTCSPAVTPAS